MQTTLRSATTILAPQAKRALQLLSRRCSSSSSSSSSSAKSSVVEPPTWRQLRLHALTMGLPMVGFGFMDNLVMIQAGDMIDNTIGVTFGLATLTSAAYGQIVSDVSGTLSSGVVANLFERLGLPRAELTVIQSSLPSVRFSGMAGAVVGVACGCLLGMTSLLFMDLEKSERVKRQRELRTLYSTLMEEGHELIGAQHCALFLVDENASVNGEFYLTSMGWTGKEPTHDELKRTFERYDTDRSGRVDAMQLYHALRQLGWTAELSDVVQMIATVDKDGGSRPGGWSVDFDGFSVLMRSAILAKEVRLKVRKGGSRYQVLTTGQPLNVRDVQTDPRISDESRQRYALRGYDVKSLLLAPVWSSDGKVIGLIELVNKELDDRDAPRAGAGGEQQEQQVLKRRNSEYGFGGDEEKLLKMLCAHCAIFLRHLDTRED